MWFLLFTMFVVFSFSCSDDVLTDENVQTLILVSFSQPKKNVSTAEGSKMKLNQKKFNLLKFEFLRLNRTQTHKTLFV